MAYLDDAAQQVDVYAVVSALSVHGSGNRSAPRLDAVPLVCDPATSAQSAALCTVREVQARYLLLNAVLDQGPDIPGVRMMLEAVASEAHVRGLDFLRYPSVFFDNLDAFRNMVLDAHSLATSSRAYDWARVNQTTPAKYNLFLENSRQVVSYLLFRWGTPLAIPLILQVENPGSREPLIEWLSGFDSAEIMSRGIKTDIRLGLGKAIGDKACHLFAKWVVASFGLLADEADRRWGRFSFEAPFDSNVGRVLWRSGFLLHWRSLEDYMGSDVVQPGKGKGGTDYLRITNIREMDAGACVGDRLRSAYSSLCVNHLAVNRRPPKKIQIQRLPGAMMLETASELGIADFDDGAIEVGTRYCLNHSSPLCDECPIQHLCFANNSGSVGRQVIERYRT